MKLTLKYEDQTSIERLKHIKHLIIPKNENPTFKSFTRTGETGRTEEATLRPSSNLIRSHTANMQKISSAMGKQPWHIQVLGCFANMDVILACFFGAGLPLNGTIPEG